MLGYYAGRIDGVWGSISHEALIQLMDQEGIEHSEISRFIEGNYGVISLSSINEVFESYHFDSKQEELIDESLILDKLTDEALDELGGEGISIKEFSSWNQNFSTHLTAETASKQYASRLDIVTASRPLIRMGQLKTTATRVESFGQNKRGGIFSFFKNLAEKGRKIYYGVKSLIQSAFHGIRKGLIRIRDKLKEWAGGVWSLLTLVTRKIRTGLKLFYQGLKRFFHFLLRKPIVSGSPGEGIVMSRYDLDFDGSVFISSQASGSLMLSHAQLCRSLAYQVNLFLVIAVKVIRHLLTAPNPISWIKLGYELANLAWKEFRRMEE